MSWQAALYALIASALLADVIANIFSTLNKYLATRQAFHFHYNKIISYHAEIAPAALRSRHRARHNSIWIMLPFRHPTTILIAGPTQAGKSFFFKQVLEHDLIQPSTSSVISVYGEQHPDLSHFESVYESV